MCYSAQVIADYKKFVRHWGADLSLREFFRLYWERTEDTSLKLPKSMDAAFADPSNDQEREIKAAIEAWQAKQSTQWEAELFKQRSRLVKAERQLATKPTATATAENEKRIAGDKVQRIMGWLADLRRSELQDRDSRIYPGWYVPVMIVEDGQKVVKPMRYQCRPAGKPAFYDTKYPGTYNARRDNLRGFWSGLYGVSHGIMVVSRFFENVTRQDAEGKPCNVVLEFKPNTGQDMLVACLWSQWTNEGERDLLSVAAITDEPPPEVAAAGHDRCIVPIKPENVDAWLTPQGRSLEDLDAILENRERPYYEHQLAA